MATTNGAVVEITPNTSDPRSFWSLPPNVATDAVGNLPIPTSNPSSDSRLVTDDMVIRVTPDGAGSKWWYGAMADSNPMFTLHQALEPGERWTKFG